MARGLRGPWKDFATGAPAAAAMGVLLDYMQSKVNPSFVGAPQAKTGWVVNGIATAVGLAGAAVGAATHDDFYFEVVEGVGQVGVAGLAQNATHAVRYSMAKSANKLPTPAAPTQVLRTTGVRQATVAPTVQPTSLRGYTGGLYPSAAF